jgi:hypothetical protein
MGFNFVWFQQELLKRLKIESLIYFGEQFKFKFELFDAFLVPKSIHQNSAQKLRKKINRSNSCSLASAIFSIYTKKSTALESKLFGRP